MKRKKKIFNHFLLFRSLSVAGDLHETDLNASMNTILSHINGVYKFSRLNVLYEPVVLLCMYVNIAGGSSDYNPDAVVLRCV